MGIKEVGLGQRRTACHSIGVGWGGVVWHDLVALDADEVGFAG